MAVNAFVSFFISIGLFDPVDRRAFDADAIRGRDGKIRSKDSYGADPNPPKDKEH